MLQPSVLGNQQLTGLLRLALAVSRPPPPSRPPARSPRPQGAHRAFAFSSGMSALAAVTRLVGVGDHIVAGDDLYGGTSRLLSRVVPAAGVAVTNVDTCDLR